jgi:hypothetical protein
MTRSASSSAGNPGEAAEHTSQHNRSVFDADQCAEWQSDNLQSWARLFRGAVFGSLDPCSGLRPSLEELRSPVCASKNLALRARAMTKRQTSHRPGKQFDQNDIIRLLKAAVEREGGQAAFAKRHRIESQ